MAPDPIKATQLPDRTASGGVDPPDAHDSGDSAEFESRGLRGSGACPRSSAALRQGHRRELVTVKHSGASEAALKRLWITPATGDYCPHSVGSQPGGGRAGAGPPVEEVRLASVRVCDACSSPRGAQCVIMMPAQRETEPSTRQEFEAPHAGFSSRTL